MSGLKLCWAHIPAWSMCAYRPNAADACWWKKSLLHIAKARSIAAISPVRQQARAHGVGDRPGRRGREAHLSGVAVLDGKRTAMSPPM
jgi:hypothetical protein